MDNNKAYHKLKEKYSPEELADAVMLPETLSEEAEIQANLEFAKLRKDRKQSMTDKEKLLSALLNFKYTIKASLNTVEAKELNFGEVLKSYITLTNRTQKQFAEEIGLHPSRLNRIIKGKEKIGKTIIYRLENHSGNTIPAIYWWRIIQQEIETEILTDTETREIEKKFVTKVAYRA